MVSLERVDFLGCQTGYLGNVLDGIALGLHAAGDLYYVLLFGIIEFIGE